MGAFAMFVDQLPVTEIKDGFVHVSGQGVEYVVTVHIFRKFLEEGRCKLDRWDRERRCEIIQLDEKRG